MADIVLSHKGIKHKIKLACQIISEVVLPAPEHFRPLLRRLAALGESPAVHKLDALSDAATPSLTMEL